MSKIKKRLRCSGCGNVWNYSDIKITAECPLCGKKKDARDRREYSREYTTKHPERFKIFKEWCNKHNRREKKDWNALIKKSVLTIISGEIQPKCCKRGCDDISLNIIYMHNSSRFNNHVLREKDRIELARL